MTDDPSTKPAAVVKSAEGRASGADVVGASAAMKRLALAARARRVPSEDEYADDRTERLADAVAESDDQ